MVVELLGYLNLEILGWRSWRSPSIEGIVASKEVARDVKLRSCRTVRSTPVVEDMKGGLT